MVRDYEMYKTNNLLLSGEVPLGSQSRFQLQCGGLNQLSPEKVDEAGNQFMYSTKTKSDRSIDFCDEEGGRA